MPGQITLTSPLPIRADAGTGLIHCAPGWGIRENGSCYFDPDGAAPGEAAVLCWVNGRHYLSNNTGDLFGVEAPEIIPEPVERCDVCGIEVLEAGTCRTCAEQQNIRNALKLRADGWAFEQIADRLTLPVPVVRHLVRKGSRKAI